MRTHKTKFPVSAAAIECACSVWARNRQFSRRGPQKLDPVGFHPELGAEFGIMLARIIHKFSTAAAQSSALAVLRSVGLLDGLHEYDCGGSPRVVSVASLAGTALSPPRYENL